MEQNLIPWIVWALIIIALILRIKKSERNGEL
jgi:hypothetical protein